MSYCTLFMRKIQKAFDMRNVYTHKFNERSLVSNFIPARKTKTGIQCNSVTIYLFFEATKLSLFAEQTNRKRTRFR